MKQPLRITGLVSLKTKISLFSLLLLGASLTAANAANSTWTDDAGDDAWSTLSNWSPSGLPPAANTAIFDGQGDSGVITVGTQSIAAIDFGQTNETTTTDNLAYTLGASGDALQFAAVTGNIINYLGSGNTSTDTIGANIVLGSGVTSTGLTYAINNSSDGDLVLNGNITNSDASITSEYLNINDTGTGNITLNGNVQLGATNTQGDTVAVNVGDTVTFGGQITDIGTLQSTISLGSSTTGTYGNLVFTNSDAFANGTAIVTRLQAYGTQGAIVFDSTAGIADEGTGGYDVFLYNGHSSESLPSLELEAGNNTLNGDLAINSSGNTGNSNYYIQVDSGATVLIEEGNAATGTAIYDNGTPITGTAPGAETQVLYLDGAGNGYVSGEITVRYATGNGVAGITNTESLVKDGTGTWALSGTYAAGGTTGKTNGTYTGGTTVEDGIFLVNGIQSTGLGAVVVDGTNSGEGSAAKPILGGTGSVGGAVSLASGATIAAGGAVNATGTVYTSPLGNIGTLTLNSSLTAVAGATFAFDINSAGPFPSSVGSSDLLNVYSADGKTGGAVTLGNATLSLTDINTGSSALVVGDYYDILNYGSLSGTFAGLAQGADVTVNGNIYSINYDFVNGSTKEVVLDYVGAAAAPEPQTWALLLLAIPVLAWQRRRTSAKV